VRQDAVTADLYGQNWLRPGCGTGRQVQLAAYYRFTRQVTERPDLLRSLVLDRDRTVRAAALLHVGEERVTGYEREIEEAAGADPDARVREYAVAALGRLGTGAATLRAALEDSDAEVRHLALAALVSMSERVDPATRRKIERESGAVVYRLSMFREG
jgi:HEAT repeat protein